MNDLSTFERLFPIAMILVPLITSLGQPSKFASDEQRSAHARLRRLLVASTLACIGVVVLMWRWTPNMAMFGWMLMFLLSPLSMRILNLKNPEVGQAWQRRRRSAALAPRDQALTPEAKIVHLIAWLVWLALLAVTVAIIASNSWRQAWLLSFHVFAPFWLIWSGWFGRRTVLEAEPLPQEPGPEILDAYASFRSARQLLWIVLGFGATLALSLPPMVLAMDSERYLTLAIILGAGGGAAGGIAGGLFGAWADRRRVALARLVLERCE